MLGVRLSFLDQFIEDCGGEGALQDLTTTEVMERWVKPETQASKLSYCELLMSRGSEKAVGTATWFYSHAWKYRFLDVVDAAKLFFRQIPEEDPVLWFDIFSVSQHKAGIRPFEWWSTVFLHSIGSIGKVLMVMQPFDSGEGKARTPAWVTLSRVWCVFELYSCEATLSEFHVTMTEGMATRFRRAMLSQTEDRGWRERLVGLDCEQSEASDAKDKALVFDVIRRTIGFPLLNSLVMLVLEKWLAARFLAAQRAAASADYPQLLQTVVEVVEAFQRRRAGMVGISRDHPDSLASMHTLAGLYREQGRREEARAACAECLRLRERVLGTEHAATLETRLLLEELGGGRQDGGVWHGDAARAGARLDLTRLDSSPFLGPTAAREPSVTASLCALSPDLSAQTLSMPPYL